jgi:hypothetical protein
MIFISKTAGHTHTLRNAKVVREPNEDGLMQTITLRPQLDADFQPLRLTEPQRVIADRMWKQINPQAPYGSVPYAFGDAMGQEFSTEDVVPGTRYVGHDPSFRMGKFDTSVDIDYASQGADSEAERAELRKFVEDTLMNHETRGKMYIRIDDSLPKPWPTYPTENGPGVAQKVIATAREIGFPLADVIMYEKTQDHPKAGVISMCEAELAKEQAAASEDDALSAVIPA